jgi:predicted DNA-binding transcriptional regulator YafY
MREVDIVEKRARDIARRTVETALGPGYGIFTGEKICTAVLRFAPERARWVGTERWHPDQTGDFSADGSYTLKVPYSDDRELMMDILKYGGDCEVLEPDSLRATILSEIRHMASKYD